MNTDKYEGRTPGQWSVTSIRDGSIPWNTADEELCADAPLLLAEVKRLRKRNKKLENALLTLADGAGDVPMFNEGGEAYEALWGEEE